MIVFVLGMGRSGTSVLARAARPVHLLPRLAYFTHLSEGRLRSLIGRTAARP